MGGDGGPDVLPGRVQRGLGRLSRSRSTSARTPWSTCTRTRTRITSTAVEADPAARASQLPGPGQTTLEEINHRELALGTRGALRRPVGHLGGGLFTAGADGYPKPIWDKVTGKIDTRWRSTGGSTTTSPTSCGGTGPHSGPRSRGKLKIYVGDMDNYYLNNAVYLVEDFLSDQGSAGRRRSGLWRPGGALLERGPDQAECALPAALSPDVHPADHGADPEKSSRRRGYPELEVLSGAR